MGGNAAPAGMQEWMVSVDRTARQGSRNPKARSAYLATIDPLWTTGLPGVQFDGENFVRQPGLPWDTAGGYVPKPGERVYVVPWVQGYIIAGPVNASGPLYLNQLYPTLNAGLTTGNTGGGYYPVSFTKTADGIVMFQGACYNSSGAVWTVGKVFFTLPVGFRPDYDLVFPMGYYGGHLSSLTVAANGDVYPNQPFSTSDSQYWAFGNVAFPAAGVASWTNYDDPGSGMALANGYTPKLTDTSIKPANYGKPRVWVDTNGFCWVQGCMNVGTVTADNTPMLTLPTSLRSAFMNHSIATGNFSGFALIGAAGNPGTATGAPSIMWKSGSPTTGWISLSSVTGYELQSALHSWPGFPGAGGWSAYGSGFTPPGYLVLPNKMVRVRGLFKGAAALSLTGTMPVGARGTQDATHTAGGPSLRVGTTATPTNAYIENNPNGNIYLTAGTGVGFFSFDIMQYALGG